VISNFLPVARLWYLYIPIFSLMLGNQLIVAPPLEYIAYAAPFTLLLHGVPSWVSHNHIHQIWSEVYETLTSFLWTKRIIRILRHPFRILGSTITPKTASARDEKFLDVPLLMHLLVFLALLLLAKLRVWLPMTLIELQKRKYRRNAAAVDQAAGDGEPEGAPGDLVAR
jgi:hypothetical protein